MGVFDFIKKKDEEKKGFSLKPPIEHAPLGIEEPSPIEEIPAFPSEPELPAPKPLPFPEPVEKPPEPINKEPIPMPEPFFPLKIEEEKAVPRTEFRMPEFREEFHEPETVHPEMAFHEMEKRERKKSHLFIKVSKYKKIMENIERLKDVMGDIAKALEHLEDIKEQEKDKLKEAESIVKNLEGIADFLDMSFKEPSE